MAINMELFATPIIAIHSPFSSSSSTQCVPGKMEHDGPGTKPDDGGSKPDGPGKMGPFGGDKGEIFNDDGFDGLKKITVGADEHSVTYIKIDYVKDEKDETREHGTARGKLEEFPVDYPNENITSVDGSYDCIHNCNTTLVTSLCFKLSNGKTSPTFGKKAGTDFTLKGENESGELLGFHGRYGHAIDAIGAHFAPPKPAKRLGAVGGDEGGLWDDGVFDGVRKITVVQGDDGVSFVKIEYNKGSQTIILDGHGKETIYPPETFELGSDEYLTALGVYYDKVQGEKDHTTLVTSLVFKTNKTTSHGYGLTGGDYVELKEEGHKIVGFHGKAGDVVHKIGVHVAPITKTLIGNTV